MFGSTSMQKVSFVPGQYAVRRFVDEADMDAFVSLLDGVGEPDGVGLHGRPTSGVVVLQRVEGVAGDAVELAPHQPLHHACLPVPTHVVMARVQDLHVNCIHDAS